MLSNIKKNFINIRLILFIILPTILAGCSYKITRSYELPENKILNQNCIPKIVFLKNVYGLDCKYKGSIKIDDGGLAINCSKEKVLEQLKKEAWSQHFDGSEVCLYALKTNGGNAALLSGADIESVTSNQDKTSKNNEIDIRFKKSSVKLWAKATKRNINNAIAIVLDNNVISAPIVCSEINGGHSTITGNYTQAEVRYIAAIGNNGELPLHFKILK